MAIEKFIQRKGNIEQQGISGSVSTLDRASTSSERVDRQAADELFANDEPKREMLIGAVEMLLSYTGIAPAEIKNLDLDDRRVIADIVRNYLTATEKADSVLRRKYQQAFQATLEEIANR
ncbi:MAG: hypothetical protein WAT81_02945 [Candidatus Moraniibacteriota bacterium]